MQCPWPITAQHCVCVCGGGVRRVRGTHYTEDEGYSHALSLTYISCGRYTCGTRIWPRNYVLTLVLLAATYIYVQTTVYIIEAWFFVICTLSVYLLYSQCKVQHA